MSYAFAGGNAERFERCWYDSGKRVTKHQTQVTKRPDGKCGSWDVLTTRQGYDDHGGLIFSEQVDEQVLPGRTAPSPAESGLKVYVPVYENGLPVRLAVYDGSLDFSYVELSHVDSYEWTDGRLARLDSFDREGTWKASNVFTWSESLLRIDWFTPQTENSGWGGVVKIYERRGPGEYVPIYEAPDTYWEYSSADNIETSTKFVRDLVVERRRFALVDGEREPLTVEQLLPDVEGLVTIERWDWSDRQRVTVERQTGRDVYLLDCSALPPIESLVDPQCPSPRPIR